MHINEYSALDVTIHDLLNNRKSLPSTILPRSVVTKLLSFPTRLSVLLELFSSAEADLTLDVLFPEIEEAVPFPFLTSPLLDLLVLEASSPFALVLDPSPLTTVTSVCPSESATEMLSGVGATVDPLEACSSDCVCAFMRILSACSKISSVMIPSVRTSVPVCQ